MKAVFFDMNETLLNLSLLKEQFNKYFDDQYVLKYWFTKLLHSSTVMGIMDEYKNFGELAEVALENLFNENNRTLTKETKSEILGAFRELPTYKDVRPALQWLKKNNIRVIAVSNSSLSMIEEQLTNAGIIDLFDQYYSVDAVKKYKPFKDIYQYVAKQEAIAVHDIVMVATHDWDLFGAKKAGLTTAYIQRKEELFHPLYAKADFYDTDLSALLTQVFNPVK
ncbi:haloacid dehalogenase type II [Saccharicrinis fermentans]|uniref:(S)-2-haloacid dehalogenase n=1 Tax=Saccharicrinis fermentans DSM 9555 = JCM 21142 TaxID=869213 RepID=W7YPK6_9BACT|nr:haloacid dehalogenase type II [Saccharicrinis fermentans]GAF04329.1 (S)-2-haloacid dehalogenase [Saccharicrinis fermentans DSM 9555 = JCM 21142]